MKLSDEGLISCTVDFSNGSTLYHKTLLQVGSKWIRFYIFCIGTRTTFLRRIKGTGYKVDTPFLFLAAPHFTTVPSQSFVSENENVSIECTSIAKPQPVIKWYDKNDTILSNSTKYILVSGIVKTIDEEIQIKNTLTIIDAGIEDAGKYKCKSFNDISADEADTTLTVYCELMFFFQTLKYLCLYQQWKDLAFVA